MHSLSINVGHAQSLADTIQDVVNVLSYSFTYEAVTCTHMFIPITYMYVYVHTSFMHVCTCIFDGALTTFGCVEWESELSRGVLRARCYPFDMPKHRFHGMNPKVLYIHCTNMYKHVIFIYIQAHNMFLHGIYMVYTMFMYVCTGLHGSNVYEVNPWLWQFGRGKPRLGGLSVEKTGDRKEAAQKEQLLRGAETRRRRKADQA